MTTLEQLQPLILKWAKDRDILKPENADKQRLKLIEECGELSGAILKQNIALQKDAIGDIFVVLIILSDDLRISPRFDFKYKKESYNNIPYWEHISNLIRHSDLIENIIFLNNLAIELELNLIECANIAWNEIKDRKGKTVNGTFIKNEGL